MKDFGKPGLGGRISSELELRFSDQPDPPQADAPWADDIITEGAGLPNEHERGARRKRVHREKKYQKEMNTIKNNEANVVVYTDAAVGDGGTAIAGYNESTGEEKTGMLRGLRSVRTAELLAIENAGKSSRALMEGKKKKKILDLHRFHRSGARI